MKIITLLKAKKKQKLNKYFRPCPRDYRHLERELNKKPN